MDNLGLKIKRMKQEIRVIKMKWFKSKGKPCKSFNSVIEQFKQSSDFHYLSHEESLTPYYVGYFFSMVDSNFIRQDILPDLKGNNFQRYEDIEAIIPVELTAIEHALNKTIERQAL
ncbi:hypothetical protein GA0061096_0246 [Fictibacillus enclensis]|uniref:Uncharacterized protein n=2 Tax=Fictibacillus enclensis TaxID=1017270 RepID=A0A0V8JAY2_9BACL|nr:hypothetical protein AS030_01165 [Fictibacillus enclensis]SCB75016.1 hypothetical protein GA0061096_0246 [Fictibacillus enclensis]